MKLIEIQVAKIIYSHNEKKYKVIFSDSGRNNFFTLFLSSEYAKKIAMSLEGIKSESLSSYDLFTNLLSISQIELEKTVILIKQKKIYSNMYLKSQNKEFIMTCPISDSIILSLKNFSKIQIDELLLENDNLFINEMKYQEPFDYIVDENSSSDNVEIDMLKKILHNCIDNEKYESAAIIRDRIKNFYKN